jgi:hypothetical protein
MRRPPWWDWPLGTKLWILGVIALVILLIGAIETYLFHF